MPVGLFLSSVRQDYASEAFPSVIHNHSWEGLAETF